MRGAVRRGGVTGCAWLRGCENVHEWHSARCSDPDSEGGRERVHLLDRGRGTGARGVAPALAMIAEVETAMRFIAVVPETVKLDFVTGLLGAGR